MENLLIKCIPGIDEDCEPGIKWVGGQNVSAAQIFHGIIALANVIAPPILWFFVFAHGTPSTILSKYKDDYWGLATIVYYMAWYFFWVIHPAVFLPAALFFPLTFFKIDWVNKTYLKLLNFDWWAMPVLYPLLLIMFIFSTSPYVVKTDLERAQEKFGSKHEDAAVWIYFSLVLSSIWVQVYYRTEL